MKPVAAAGCLVRIARYGEFVTRSGHLLVSVVVFASVALAAMVAPVNAESGPVTSPAEITALGWGQYSVVGDFRSPVVVPDQRSVIGFGETLNRYDFDTNDVTVGAVLDPVPRHLLMSSTGAFVYAISFGGDGTNGLTTIGQYTTSDLQPVRTFSRIESEVDNGGASPIIVVLPGDEERVLYSSAGTVTSGGTTALYEQGRLLPDSIDEAFYLAVPFDDGSVFAISAEGRSGDVRRLIATETGLADTGDTVDGANQDVRGAFREMVRRGNELIVGTRVYTVPDLVERPATGFDYALPDPDLPLRYGRNDEDLETVIYDAVTGEILSPLRPCDAGYGYFPFVGGGFQVRSRHSAPNLIVTHVPDRCGAYGEFVPLDPTRVVDSRDGTGLGGNDSPLRAGEVRRIKIHGRAGIPESGLESVVLNVTAINQRNAERPNYVTVWPAGFEQPPVSSLNISNGQTVGNMVTVSTAADGFVDVYSDAGDVDLTIDVMGYFRSSLSEPGARFEKIPTQRVLDTREEDRRLGPASSLSLDVSNLAPDAVAIVANVTAVRPTEGGHMRIHPTGSDLPLASSMNFPAAANTNRLVTVKVNQNGSFDVWNRHGTTDVTVDIVGMYVDASTRVNRRLQDGRFVGFVPFREVDTRTASPFDGDGRLPARSAIFTSGYPLETSVVANISAIATDEAGYLSIGPWKGTTRNLEPTSSLNFSAGSIIGNQAIFSPSERGAVGIYNSNGNTHITVDVFGYYTAVTTTFAQSRQPSDPRLTSERAHGGSREQEQAVALPRGAVDEPAVSQHGRQLIEPLDGVTTV